MFRRHAACRLIDNRFEGFYCAAFDFLEQGPRTIGPGSSHVGSRYALALASTWLDDEVISALPITGP